MDLFRVKNIAKNYTVIIIPEKGARTKTLNLSIKALKITTTISFILVIVMCFFLFRYMHLSKTASALEEKDKYIKTLEEENKEKQEKINNFSTYENTIKIKLNELENLEKDIKSKIDKSTSSIDANQIYATPKNPNAAVINNGDVLVKEMDKKILSFSQINKDVSRALAREKFIPSFIPCKGNISSEYGTRRDPFNNKLSDFHAGVDISCDYGTKIYAAASGTVIFSGYRSGYGNSITIDHKNGLRTIYGHASKLEVESGQTVEKGDLIALVGSTGSSTGPHLHFEIRRNDNPIDPLEFINKE
jgi:murein DD-endopeptidase MepM/ murein hydrolase activator NlpD